jgi:hypothetical protein
MKGLSVKRLSWRALNDVLTQLTEDELVTMLNEERTGERRASVLQRLHQRYTIVRASRERGKHPRDAAFTQRFTRRH